ncbi:hypothetical protein TWF569_004923 [Orbilia oligospora]|uniref:Cytochrome b5 heme-binding domain-containing protein n=1 Tax=Orbilia oligospora TaxID=2813651 RepID=A0A7C8N734_ORBOL|nr:hypothetical protein TWF103_004015 [Orbilia oligospora]KAF3092350.1 hypothetical protein TWF102_008433 [Orbilia oligospora]KAF3109566.1 hypothetical protein TWF706_001429 [Orbilia oligospora]KAF3122962.1 hypothetical protein TWF594_002576 [Orbilia oligospora]KAF3149746.1 hypothetical protein TWF569_004923 [Orbilia oligospora]
MATETKEYTYADVAAHDTKESMYVVIDDKVYDVSPFVDEHPGGEEVMLDVAGQDGTEAFEDVGHSDEAREILSKYLIGNLKRSENDPKPIKISQAATSSSGESSGGLYVRYSLFRFLFSSPPKPIRGIQSVAKLCFATCLLSVFRNPCVQKR